jgi:hypothetical protein
MIPNEKKKSFLNGSTKTPLRRGVLVHTHFLEKNQPDTHIYTSPINCFS